MSVNALDAQTLVRTDTDLPILSPPLRSSTKRVLGVMPNTAQQGARAVLHRGNAELMIVEFDDQGSCYERGQMRAVTARLARLQADDEDAVIVTFAHGWKHNASGDDENLRNIVKVLDEIGAEEAKKGPARRPVIGIFIGWRGLSLYGLETENLTFWDRKQAGARVATGSVRELLGRLRQFRLDRDAKQAGRTVLVIVGHSFGGMIVYTAIAQSLIEAAATQGAAVPAFANLVLLVNPAFEAVRYLAVHTLVKERFHQTPPPPPQPTPVFVSITAENDWATGTLFPLGMAIALLQESATEPEERPALWHTMGHLKWLETHTLALAPAKPAGSAQRRFGDAILTRVRFGAENPFWNVRAAKQIVDGHDGIFMPPFLAFLQELVFDHMN